MALKVRARGTAMVPRWEALPARRFVGREPVLIDGKAGWAPVVEAVEVLDCAEYRSAVKDGDLWAADEATAKLVGVPYDPTFEGDYDNYK